jgi:hypothetical protein
VEREDRTRNRIVCCYKPGKAIRRKSKNDCRPNGTQAAQLETANNPGHLEELLLQGKAPDAINTDTQDRHKLFRRTGKPLGR